MFPGQATASSHPSTQGKKPKLTIENPSKIEAAQGKKRFYKHRPSRGVVYLKWISTFILAALLLAFVTQSKVSVISIAEQMHRAADGEATADACRMFVMLFLIVLIPNCVNLLRGIWEGLFRKDIPWPNKRALILVSLSFLNIQCVYMYESLLRINKTFGFESIDYLDQDVFLVCSMCSYYSTCIHKAFPLFIVSS